MTSVKVKIRPSIVENREGTVYYQLIHNRVTRQINTDYKIFPGEWNKRSAVCLQAKVHQSHLSVLYFKPS